MFFSLNKKILLTILTFFLLSAAIFVFFFDNTIGKKIRNEQTNLITRNQYVIELLNENISLRQKLEKLQPENKMQSAANLDQKKEELSRERKLNEELTQNYDESYAAIQESFRILGRSAFLTTLSLIILWILLKKWVVTPVDRLTSLSIDVANGDFSKRLDIKEKHFTDEFNTLMHTVNFMLNNIEHNINEIKEKEIFLQNLIDALPDAVRIIDEDYNIVLANKAYDGYIKKQYLFKSAKCYGAYNGETQCPCSASLYLCPLKELQKSKSSGMKTIHSVNNRPLSVNSARIHLNGKFGIVESFRDLSDNINYSHQQKISSLGFLATSLAHEMKNNLGAINLILDGILQKYYSAPDNESEEKKYLNMISGQIKDCIKVPERLLKLSRNTEQTNTTFNVIAEITDILSLLDYDIKSKGIVLTQNFSNVKEEIYGNETDFKMIILNLLQNAIHAMPDGGTLEIKTNTNKDDLIISIKDSGCGISKNALKHIFEPFYSSSPDNEKKGTGLGLAIVKDLVLKLNAKITVSSTENVGSCFEITIPRHKSQKMLVK